MNKKKLFSFLLVLAMMLGGVSVYAGQAKPMKKSTLNLEAAMRAWQERWVMATGADQIYGLNNPNGLKPIVWPARLSDGLSPGPYPEDCFYLDDMQDPGRAAALVLNFISAVSTSMGQASNIGTLGIIRRFDPLWENWNVAPPSGPNTVSTVALLYRWLGTGNTWSYRDPSSSPWVSDFSGVTKDNYPTKFQTVVDHWLNTPCQVIWWGSPNSTGTPWKWTHTVARADYSDCDCLTCATGDCTIGGFKAVGKVVNVSFSLGQCSKGPMGRLQIFQELPSSDLATPYKLSVRLLGRIPNAKSPTSNSATQSEGYTIYDSSTYLTKGYQLLRQVVTPQGLVDIVVSSGTSYTLYFYDAAHRGNLSGNYYAPDPSNAQKTIKVENPGGDINTLRITESTGQVHTYTYASNTWSLTEGTGSDQATNSVSNNFTTGTGSAIGDVRQEVETNSDQGGHLSSKESRTYQIFPWNADSGTQVPFTERGRRDELTQVVEDPDAGGAQLTTIYRYYTDVAVTSPNYGRLKQIERYDGSWSRYEYDAQGRVTRTYTPFKDSPAPAAAAGVPNGDYRLSETVYGSNPTETTTDSIMTGGSTSIIGRHFRNVDDSGTGFTVIKDVQATTSSAAYADSSNLVTTSRIYKTGDFIGKTERSVNPDGTVAIYIYSYVIGGNTTSITLQGVPSTSDPMAAGDVSDGTRTTVITNPQGQEISRTTIDAASGLTVESTTYTNQDLYGRWQQAYYLGNLTESRTFDCCGLTSNTSTAQIRTSYQYDSLHRVVRETQYLGAQSTAISDVGYTYDSKGRRISTTRYPTSTSVDTNTPTSIVEEVDTYNLAGQLVSSRSPIGTTNFVQDKTAEGRWRTTATYADSGTKIDVQRLDGSPESVSGTAVAPMKYDCGIDATGYFTQTVKVGDAGATTEWTKEYVDFAGRSSSTVLADGATATRNYDGNGRLVSETRPADSTVTGAKGVMMLYSYNTRGEVDTTAIDMNQNGIIDFNGSDRITKTTRVVATSTHDSSNYIVNRVTTAVWGTTALDSSTVISTTESTVDGLKEWDTRYGLTSSVSRSFDSNASATITSVSPDGTQKTESYTGPLLISSVTTANSVSIARTDLHYDGYGRLETSTDAVNGATSFKYYANGLLKSLTSPDPDGTKSGPGYDAQVTSYAYDSMGRQSSVTLPDAAITYSSYWPTGLLKRTWGARTNPQEMNYDAQGRLHTLATWSTFTDESSFASPTGKAVTTWNYNPQRGWLDSKVYNDGHGPTYLYYPSGSLQKRTWARGVSGTYSYDTAGQLTGIAYSDPTVPISFTYDRLGRPNLINDAAGSMLPSYKDLTPLHTADTYQAGGLLANQSMTFGYDALLRRNNLGITGANYSVTTNYEENSRIASIISTQNGTTITSSYSYNSNSSLVAGLIQKNGGNIILNTAKTYDRLNRLTAIISTTGIGAVFSSTYGYNSANQRIRLTESDGKYWDYGYDSLGQLTNGTKRISDGTAMLGHAYGYNFDTIGNRTSTQINGNTANYRTDLTGLNEYVSRDVPGVAEVTGSADPSASVFVNLFPAERQNDLFHKQIAVDNTTNPVWQPMSIIASSPHGSPDGSDALQKQQGNLFVPATPEAYTYDFDGNLNSDGRWIYTWDAENRLLSMETQAAAVSAGTPRQKLEFVYDLQGRRIQKKVSLWNNASSSYVLSSDLRFVYDGWNLLGELDPSYSIQRSYVWGLDLSNSVIGAGGVGGLLTASSKNAVDAPAYNGNGDLVALIGCGDSSVVGLYEYGPFGEVVKATGAALHDSLFGFSSKYTDAESGLNYYGFRYYNPSVGRWLSRDPIEEVGGVNIYSFTVNTPTNAFDTDGRQIETIIKPGIEIGKTTVEGGRWDGADYSQFLRDQPSVPIPLLGQSDPFKNTHVPPQDWMETPEPDVLDKDQNIRSKLYRSMAGDVSPEVGDEYTRQLGVRLDDVAPYGETGCVCPKSPDGKPVGMSVTTNIYTMYLVQRPKFLPGGVGKKPVWSIYQDQIGSELIYQPDPSVDPNHGVISPAKCMPLSDFRKLIHATQMNWRRVQFMDRRTIT